MWGSHARRRIQARGGASKVPGARSVRPRPPGASIVLALHAIGEAGDQGDSAQLTSAHLSRVLVRSVPALDADPKRTSRRLGLRARACGPVTSSTIRIQGARKTRAIRRSHQEARSPRSVPCAARGYWRSLTTSGRGGAVYVSREGLAAEREPVSCVLRAASCVPHRLSHPATGLRLPPAESNGGDGRGRKGGTFRLR